MQKYYIEVPLEVWSHSQVSVYLKIPISSIIGKTIFDPIIVDETIFDQTTFENFSKKLYENSFRTNNIRTFFDQTKLLHFQTTMLEHFSIKLNYIPPFFEQNYTNLTSILRRTVSTSALE